MISRAANIAITVVIDICLIIIVAIPGTIIDGESVQPAWRGFYCNDFDILYPYAKDTINSIHVVIISLLVPMLLVITTQLLAFKREKTSAKKQTVAGSAYRQLVAVALGLVFTRLLTSVIKCYCGRLRPYFYDVCRPRWNSGNCSDVTGQPRFITEYTCTGSNTTEARISFPSGHTSTAAFGMFYIVLYLHFYWQRPCAQVPRLFIQALAILFTGIIGVSRVTDNAHHSSDVLAGFLLGSGIACLAVTCTGDPFAELTTDSPYEELDGSVGLQPQQSKEIAGPGFEDTKLP